MKKIYFLSLAFLTLLVAGCKSEKKVTYYSDIYAEKPTLIFLSPVEDQTERRVEKYPKDAAYNNELNTAASYMFQTMAHPLINHGYYVIGTVASEQIAEQIGFTPKQWRNSGLQTLSQKYGVDAVLNTTIIRWAEENGKWIAYLEYQLRSAKTNVELMHKWVKAVKEVPTNLKGDPIVMQGDKNFAKKMGFDNGTAQRCFLLEKVNDYVLRNIPISSSVRQYEDDLYKAATETYILYKWSEEGKADVQKCSIEEFEQGAYL